jgi:hypothetical protein
MVIDTLRCATVWLAMSPWQVAHWTSARMCGAWFELHVRRRRVVEHALPGQILAALPHFGDELDARLVRGDGVVAQHAGAHAREPRHRVLGDALMAVLGAGDLLADVDHVRELDRLDGIGALDEPVVERRAERRPRGGEHIAVWPGRRSTSARCGT